jgi:hypothetical protein
VGDAGKKEKRRGPAPPGGVINIDSFLRPLLDDLEILAGKGVTSSRWDVEEGIFKNFTLRAHLVVVIGDMPVISKVSSPSTLPHIHIATALKLMYVLFS